jgi:hypothetical protein
MVDSHRFSEAVTFSMANSVHYPWKVPGGLAPIDTIPPSGRSAPRVPLPIRAEVTRRQDRQGVRTPVTKLLTIQSSKCDQVSARMLNPNNLSILSTDFHHPTLKMLNPNNLSILWIDCDHPTLKIFIPNHLSIRSSNSIPMRMTFSSFFTTKSDDGSIIMISGPCATI